MERSRFQQEAHRTWDGADTESGEGKKLRMTAYGPIGKKHGVAVI